MAQKKGGRLQEITLSYGQQESIHELLRERGKAQVEGAGQSMGNDDKNFLRQVSDAHSELVGLGFTTEQVERALVQCSTTKRDALLDWLSLELTNEELPPAFRGRVIQDKSSGGGSIQVVVPTAHPQPPVAQCLDPGAVAEEARLAQAKAAEAAAMAEVAAAAERKRWILQRVEVTAREEATRAAEARVAAERQAEAAAAEEATLARLGPVERLKYLQTLLVEALAAQAAMGGKKTKDSGIAWGVDELGAGGGVEAGAGAAAARRVALLKSDIAEVRAELRKKQQLKNRVESRLPPHIRARIVARAEAEAVGAPGRGAAAADPGKTETRAPQRDEVAVGGAAGASIASGADAGTARADVEVLAGGDGGGGGGDAEAEASDDGEEGGLLGGLWAEDPEVAETALEAKSGGGGGGGGGERGGGGGADPRAPGADVDVAVAETESGAAGASSGVGNATASALSHRRGNSKAAKAPTLVLAAPVAVTWSGKLPKRLLEEWCQKAGLGPPRFKQPPGAATCVCTVSLKALPAKGKAKAGARKAGAAVSVGGGAGRGAREVVAEYGSPADNDGSLGKSAAQHVAATRVLFELNRDKPMYHVLPPVCGALWRGWLAEEAALAEADALRTKQAQDETVERLAASMRSAKAKDVCAGGAVGRPAPAMEKLSSASPAAEPAGDVSESWEDLVKEKPAPAPSEAVPESWEDLVDEVDAGGGAALGASAEEGSRATAAAPALRADAGCVPARGSAADAAAAQAAAVLAARARSEAARASAELGGWWAAREATPQWQRMAGARAQLPMADHRKELLAAVGLYTGAESAGAGSGEGGCGARGAQAVRARVAVVCGATGCGKTTQLPQFILEEAFARGAGAQTKVVVTQPRRVAATSVAARVASEMGEPSGPGGLVGYAIRGESRQSPQTQLLFCTVGILLRRLQDDPTLADVSHVIVDEGKGGTHVDRIAGGKGRV